MPKQKRAFGCWRRKCCRGCGRKSGQEASRLRRRTLLWKLRDHSVLKSSFVNVGELPHTPTLPETSEFAPRRHYSQRKILRTLWSRSFLTFDPLHRGAVTAVKNIGVAGVGQQCHAGFFPALHFLE